MLNRRLAVGLFTGFIDLAAFFLDTSFCFLRCERPGDQLVLFFALSLSFCRGKSFCRISTSHRRRFTLFNRERLSVCRTLPRVYSPDFAAFRRLLIIGMLTLLTLLLKYDTKFCNWLCRVAGRDRNAILISILGLGILIGLARNFRLLLQSVFLQPETG